MALRPGEIYFANLPDGSRRPVIVVSRESLNRGETVFAVPVTSARFDARSRLPNCTPLNAGKFGLDRNCVAQAENAAAMRVSRLDTSTGSIGRLDDQSLRDLIRAVGFVMEATCEPD